MIEHPFLLSQFAKPQTAAPYYPFRATTVTLKRPNNCDWWFFPGSFDTLSGPHFHYLTAHFAIAIS
jgi:hypothetical protein